LEKVFLNLNKEKETIFFVQVGSNDGVGGDPLHDIIVKNKKWRGIFIEPVDYLFERLVKNYGNEDRFIFEKKAISTGRGTADYFYVSEKAKEGLDDALPFWYDQLGSFNRNHIIEHLDGILEPYIVTESIETFPLQDILDKNGVKDIDVLHIDTEGHDYKVLSSFNISKYLPSIILFEHDFLSQIERKLANSLLKKNGYHCFHYIGDTLALNKRKSIFSSR
jgi:FkbM family methyltransferase